MTKGKPYIATFIVAYDDYMIALQKGFLVKGPKLRGRNFIFKKMFHGLCRKEAVNRACQWYWKILKGTWGQAHQILVLEDHYNEVRYSDDFSCSDKTNRYLDEKTILLLLKDANGELIREKRVGDKHHPTNSVKRKKRRRKYLQKVAPSIYRSPATGVLYYAHTVVPQISENGAVVQRRKRENVKLIAKDLKKAQREVAHRFGEPPNTDGSPKTNWSKLSTEL